MVQEHDCASRNTGDGLGEALVYAPVAAALIKQPALCIRNHQNLKQMMKALQILADGGIGTNISNLALCTTKVTWDKAGSISFEPAQSPPPPPPQQQLQEPRPKDTKLVVGKEQATSLPKTTKSIDTKDVDTLPLKPLPLEE